MTTINTKAKPTETQIDRGYGALLGQAVGDTLGAQVEFQTAEKISESHPNGVRHITGGGPHKILPGQITDDTELALAMARSIVKHKDYVFEDVARAYVAWKQSHPFDCGGTCGNALGGFRPIAEIPAHHDVEYQIRQNAERRQKSEANGSLMRISPLGVYGWNRPIREIAEIAQLDSAMTHTNTFCRAVCDVFTHAIAFAIREKADAWNVFDRALSYSAFFCGPYDRVTTLLEAAKTSKPEKADGGSQGWAAIAFQNAFFQLLHNNFVEGVVDTISLGGDTDTNAAIAGALLGSVHGAAAIPPTWEAAVITCKTNRGPTYQTYDLLDLSIKLLEAEGDS